MGNRHSGAPWAHYPVAENQRELEKVELTEKDSVEFAGSDCEPYRLHEGHRLLHCLVSILALKNILHRPKGSVA